MASMKYNTYELKGVTMKESRLGLIRVVKGDIMHALTTDRAEAIRRFILAVKETA